MRALGEFAGFPASGKKFNVMGSISFVLMMKVRQLNNGVEMTPSRR